METRILLRIILVIALLILISVERIRRSKIMSTSPVTREQLDQLVADQTTDLQQLADALTALVKQDAQTIADLQAKIAAGATPDDFATEFASLTANNASIQNALAAVQTQTATDTTADPGAGTAPTGDGGTTVTG